MTQANPAATTHRLAELPAGSNYVLTAFRAELPAAGRFASS